MKRLLTLAFALLPVLALAAGSQSNTLVSATSTASTVTFGFNATYILVSNGDSTNEIFIDFTGATATTSSFRLEHNRWIAIPSVWSGVEPGRASISVVCSPAETAQVNVLALR